ncbi:peptidase dimerization domain-containing protein [Paeniglutamicibacter cryotolerans]|uniref:Metal-dependent amidase/aminoacylase/carboxypeptidase family protein n=1 Tax=Paeniglutamicibacter cryotolerans TaxID=670079 RepID=A0A839QZ81_9MICC|nr:peptidase dimerization domain-containing protein [Paeniglutamicibacter cryotolerans]MBB2997281.1 metal-dependent amidase/aminoacylase/carboxypeptidase family protein [Paeniglutamicibacter cryotolerans]
MFQPAEERAARDRAIVADGLFERAPKPSVARGRHVAPLPAGMLGRRSGAAFAGADQLTITMHGRGGDHGSRLETPVDPVVMAVAAVRRLQTVIAREVADGDSAVLTAGQVQAGSKHNVIPNDAVLGLSVRSSIVEVHERVMSGIERIVNAEAAASVAEREPEIVLQDSLPVLVNDTAATSHTRAAFDAGLTGQAVMDPGAVTGSDDVGIISDAAGVPLCFWLLGDTEPAEFAAASAAGTVDRGIPSNHSPHFAPLISPTLEAGIAVLVVAARERLDEAT